MHAENVLVILFSIAALVALFARWFKLPYTVALVLAGLGLGATHALPAVHLTQELLFAVFLPGLIFEAAFHLDARAFWRNKFAINALAVPGVVATIGLVGALLAPALGSIPGVERPGFGAAMVFAALIAATDPIAVVALFKSLGVPRRLSVLVEGESLLNDGTSVVLFTIVMGVVGGGNVSVPGAIWEFVRVVGLGALAGGAVGYAVSLLIRWVDDPMIEITLTTVAAYGSFLAAERMGASGVIATVCAGMVCGSYGAATGMSPSTRVAVETFWEYVAFALNSVVFLLIGLEVRLGELARAWQAILMAYLVVTVGRSLVVGTVALALRPTRERVPRGWGAVLTWGGLRGALSMVLALSLPQGFAHRDLIVRMTFGVVTLSILLQGTTMGRLLRQLGLSGDSSGRGRYDRERGALQAARAALMALDDMTASGTVTADVAEPIRARLTADVARSQEAIRALHAERGPLREEELRAAERQLLVVQKDALQRALQSGAVGREAYEHLVGDVDAQLVRLEGE